MNTFVFAVAGDIVPPENFKRYVPHVLPPVSPRATSTEPKQVPDELISTDLFGQQIPLSKAKSPLMWKISYRSNHPNIDAVTQDMYNRKLRHMGFKIPIGGK